MRLVGVDYSNEGGWVTHTKALRDMQQAGSSFRSGPRSGKLGKADDKKKACSKCPTLSGVIISTSRRLPDNYSPTHPQPSSARTGLFIAFQGRPEAAIPKALIPLCLDLKGRILAGQAARPCFHGCVGEVERLLGRDDGGVGIN